MKHLALFLSIMLSAFALQAQDVTTVEAASADISDHLDLEAVAAVFADAEDLEDFERLLNDPDKHISNLDLNEDGYVDYLRVVELADDNIRVITVQAIIGKDLYQDVATIDVERDDQGKTRVQVVGDVYMYGPDYVIEPVYIYRPRIYTYLWAPRIRPWCSSFYWGFYPRYWSFWAPLSFNAYWGYVHPYHGMHAFYYRPFRRSVACARYYRTYRRNDYGAQHPNRGFSTRNAGYTNKLDRTKNERPAEMVSPSSRAGVTADTRPTAKPNTSASTSERPSSTQTKPNKVSTRPGTKEGVSTSKPNRVGRPLSNSSTSSRPSADTKPNTRTPSRTSTKPQLNSGQKPTTVTKPRTSSSAKPSSRTERKPSVSTKPRTSSSSTRTRTSTRNRGTSTSPSRSSRSTASPSRSSRSNRSTASPSRSSRSSGNVSRGSSRSSSRSSVSRGSSSRSSSGSRSSSSRSSSSKKR